MANQGFQFGAGRFQGDAEPEQTLERFEKYLVGMERVFRLNRRAHPVTGARIDFDDAEKKDILQLEGGDDMADLFRHVGMCWMVTHSPRPVPRSGRL